MVIPMNQSKIIVTTVLSTLLVTALGMTLAGSLAPGLATAHAGGGGWRGHRSHGDPCARLSRSHTRVVEAVVATHLDLDSDQEAAMEPLLEVLDGWRVALSESCVQGVAADDVPEALAAIEQALGDSAAAVGELKARYGAFYGVLNDEQKSQIDDAFARHRARHGGEAG